MSVEVKRAIDTLTAEKGSKKGSIWSADISVKDILDHAGLENTEGNQRYVKYILGRWYPGSTVSPGQSDNGGFVRTFIRSK